jgi:serine/threonine protein kinase/Tfp pilus assembly protein PilF
MGIMASQEPTVEQLFGAALDRRPEDRRAFLDRVCAGAPELRQRVDELLLADEQAGSFLERKPQIFADQSNLTLSAVETNGGHAETCDFGPTPTGRFEPGQAIAGRFIVIRFIDRGGMGEVYEVEDCFLQGVHVALKVILPHIANDAESAHRFKREVLLARKVAHPNLCPIYDIAHCELPPPPFLFLTMKLLSGETLASRLGKTTTLSRSEIILIFRQMIAGVAAMHAAGVVHGDIKPKNIMLEYSGSGFCLSIMDFGLARLYASQTTVFMRESVAGTPGYIAPELLRGNPPSQATDIFALGVLLQQVLTDEKPNVELDGLSVKPSAALDAADAPPLFIDSVREFLSHNPSRRCHAFEQIRSAFESGGDLEVRKLVASSGDSHHSVLSRRNFIVGSSLATCGVAVGVVWNWDGLTNRANELLHPLPARRFVALLNWPPTSDNNVKPILAGVIDAIGNELARAEAFDRNLFVIPQNIDSNTSTTAQLNDVKDRLGANLVLAASGATRANQFHLSLRVLDPSSTRSIREKQIRLPLADRISFLTKAVRAAAELLDVNDYRYDDRRTSPDTQSPEAYAAFQEARTLMKQDNDKGLDAAIEKYKEAVDLDPRYATAHARLALAYLHFYEIHGDAAALSLARGNCDNALSLNPDLAIGHLALSALLEQEGDKAGAFREMARALAIDPTDPVTLVYQAQLYTRYNQWSEAEQTFARVLKLRPNFWLAHDELGVVFNAQGKYPQAITEFRTASLAAPKNALALNNLGAVYLQQGKLTEASDNVTRSLAIAPSDSAVTTKAAILRCQGKYADAVRAGQRSVEMNPSEAANWLELGDCYSLAQGLRRKANDAYSRGVQAQEEELRTDHTNGPGWMLLALCRVKSGAPDTARSLVAKADSLYAGDMYSRLFKARILELIGDREQALAEIGSCLQSGATVFQIRTMVDMEPLLNDRRYEEMERSNSSATEQSL